MKIKYTIPAGYSYNPALLELIENNHCLIAGTTGSGKSVLENGIINALICSKYPFDNDNGKNAQIILFDPKKVELDLYKNLPHTLLYSDTIPGIENGLKKIKLLVDQRFYTMKKRGLKTSQEVPVYVFIDEIVDIVTNKEHGKNIIRLLSDIASISRAANIFFVCLTQSPSRTIIPAQFKLLFNCRVALKCNNAIESRQIIDTNEAVNLPKHGLGLVQKDIERYYIKIPLYPDADLQRLVKSWTKQHKFLRRFLKAL